jgi:hypothetical protein
MGSAAARAGQAAARRVGPHRRLPGRRVLCRAVAGVVRPAAWVPVGPGRVAAAAAVPQARYQLGYESLCREVADSISWRRFCRIGLDRPVPHPTTLVKLVRRAGPNTVGQLNSALLGKLREDKLLRVRKLRVDTTVVEADIDHPPTPTCWRRPSASWVGSSGGSRAVARPPAPGSGTGRGRRGGGSSRSPGPCGGGPGRRQRRLIGSPPRSPPSPGRRSGRPSGSPTPPAARGVPGPPTATLGGWSGGWTRRPR